MVQTSPSACPNCRRCQERPPRAPAGRLSARRSRLRIFPDPAFGRQIAPGSSRVPRASDCAAAGRTLLDRAELLQHRTGDWIGVVPQSFWAGRADAQGFEMAAADWTFDSDGTATPTRSASSGTLSSRVYSGADGAWATRSTIVRTATSMLRGKPLRRAITRLARNSYFGLGPLIPETKSP
jgi:hypothetical protein